MLHMPTPMLMAGGKTYDDWVAHVNSIAVATVSGANSIGLAPNFSNLKVQSVSASGTMYGSSWASYVTTDSLFNRIIQHGMASEAKFLACAVGKIVLVDTLQSGTLELFNAVNRNGYTSLEVYNAGGLDACLLTRLAYWDEDLKAAMRVTPSTGSGPVPYTHAGWTP